MDYVFWRDLENLPTFMAHLEQVRITREKRSRWSVGAPFGKDVEWDAEIIDETPGGAVGKAVAKYFGEEPHQQLEATCAGPSRCRRPVRCTGSTHPARE